MKEHHFKIANTFLSALQSQNIINFAAALFPSRLPHMNTFRVTSLGILITFLSTALYLGLMVDGKAFKLDFYGNSFIV